MWICFSRSLRVEKFMQYSDLIITRNLWKTLQDVNRLAQDLAEQRRFCDLWLCCGGFMEELVSLGSHLCDGYVC